MLESITKHTLTFIFCRFGALQCSPLPGLCHGCGNFLEQHLGRSAIIAEFERLALVTALACFEARRNCNGPKTCALTKHFAPDRCHSERTSADFVAVPDVFGGLVPSRFKTAR